MAEVRCSMICRHLLIGNNSRDGVAQSPKAPSSLKYLALQSDLAFGHQVVLKT